MEQKRVVVTGLGAITPIGNDVNSFWDHLIAGQCGIDFITRFDISDYKVKIAAEVKDFDPKKYMEKSEIRRSDLYTHYAMAAALEAVTDSGIEDQVDPERFGVYFGSGIGGLNTFVAECNKLEKSGHNRVSPFFIPMMIANIAAGSIAIKHNAQGPCLSTVTACATSTNAVGEAFRAIKFGYADAIIAGGSEASIAPVAVAGFANCMALSARNDPKTACVPFDKRRDGFVMGEGAGVIILEEYEHAKRRNAKIYAEIIGYGNACDAYHITAPHPEAQGAANAIRQAVTEAGFENETHMYINAHGTSTPLNDKAETLAIKKAFGAAAATMMISSTKSMTGHMLGATGAIEAIAAILALENGIIPPTIGYAEPDEDCDLDYVPNIARKANIHAALSTSMGFGGHNACIAFKRV